MTSIAIRVVFEFEQQVFDIDRKSMELNHALRDTFGTRLMKNSCFWVELLFIKKKKKKLISYLRFLDRFSSLFFIKEESDLILIF